MTFNEIALCSWIRDRLEYVYNENPNCDFMQQIKKMIERNVVKLSTRKVAQRAKKDRSKAKIKEDFLD